MKKITTLILALVMIVSAFAIFAFAADGPGWDVVLKDGIILNLYEDKTRENLIGSVEVPAKKMGEKFNIDGKLMSVAEYANAFIDEENQLTYNRSIINLAQAMLNYGKTAREYWNYDGADIQNGNIVDYVNSALVNADIEDPVYDGADKYIGASLTLDGRMVLRLYFEEGAKVCGEDENEILLKSSDRYAGYYYVEEPITPKEIFKTFTYTCDGAVVTYSPLNYLKNTVNSDAASTELKNLVASIYDYGFVAQSYREHFIQLDYLQVTKDDYTKHEYNRNELVEDVGTVAYNTSIIDDDNYYVYNDGKTISYIVEVTDTTFDTLSVELAEGAYLRFAFLAEKPVLGERVKYAEGYCTFKAAWTFDFTVDIPSDAKYFIMSKMDDKNDVTPKKMTFTKNTTVLENLQNATSDVYSYPIENLVFDHGVINDVGASGNKWFKGFDEHAFCNDGDCKIAIIDITKCGYNYITLLQDAYFAKQLGWTFLTELPERRQPVSYAEGYCIDGKNGFKWASDNADKDGNRHSAYNIEIPNDAKYFVLYYMETYYSDGESVSNDWRYYPNSITFSKGKIDPHYFLYDEDIEEFSYPMDNLVSSAGTITYWDENGKTITDGDHFYYTNVYGNGEGAIQNAFIDITKIAFDYVTIASNGRKSAGWTFLKEMPEEGKPVSYAKGYNDSFHWSSSSSSVNVKIPEDATCLAIYTFENVSYIPASITFTKAPIEDPYFYLNNTVFYEYSYPMDKVESAGGCIIYWNVTEKDENGEEQILAKGDNVFHSNFNNEGVGKYQNAFIEINDEMFDYVTIVSNGTKQAAWAFLSELPEEGKKASYVGVQGFTWSLNDGNETSKKIKIPDGAKYLAIWYEEEGSNYVPKSITFSYDPSFYITNDIYPEYTYPNSSIENSSGAIAYWDKDTGDNLPEDEPHYYSKNIYDMGDGYYKNAFINISNRVFDYVTLVPAKKSVGYAFLTEKPKEGEAASYAKGYTTFEWSSSATTVKIPEDAKYLVIYAGEIQNGAWVDYRPKSVTFCDPWYYMNNDVYDVYCYTKDNIPIIPGAIWYTGSHDYNSKVNTHEIAIVNVNSNLYDTVDIKLSKAAIDGGDPWVCYAFLKEYPTNGKVVSYADGYSTFKFATYDCTVDIPKDAKYMVFYSKTEGNGLNYIPDALTFNKNNSILHNLSNPELDEYTITTDRMIGDKNSICYYNSDDATRNVYRYDNKCKIMLIKIQDLHADEEIRTVFNNIIIKNDDGNYLAYAFLTEAPVVGEKVSYCDGYKSFVITNAKTVSAMIPEDAEYLAVYYQDSYTETFYPESITFTRSALKDETLDEYNYPMDELFVPQNYLVHYTKLIYGSFDLRDTDNEEWKVAVIDITHIKFTKLTLTSSGWMGLTFLKEAPVDKKEVVFAGNYTGYADNYGETIDIPSDAMYLVIWYQDNANEQYYPTAIKFSK